MRYRRSFFFLCLEGTLSSNSNSFRSLSSCLSLYGTLRFLATILESSLCIYSAVRPVFSLENFAAYLSLSLDLLASTPKDSSFSGENFHFSREKSPCSITKAFGKNKGFQSLLPLFGNGSGMPAASSKSAANSRIFNMERLSC